MNEGYISKLLKSAEKFFQRLVRGNEIHLENVLYEDSVLTVREKKFIENYLELKKLESALDYQNKTKPVVKNILRVLQGEATEDDYIKIYRQLKPHQVSD
jgi:uncharacterized protein (DUF433 family)